MTDFSQGDLIRISGFQNEFLIVSNNAFIRTTGVFHICPIIKDAPEGPLHISVTGIHKTTGTVVCEQVKIIDPQARSCRRVDRLSYEAVMNVSDALQGIFEYD